MHGEGLVPLQLPTLHEQLSGFEVLLANLQFNVGALFVGVQRESLYYSGFDGSFGSMTIVFQFGFFLLILHDPNDGFASLFTHIGHFGNDLSVYVFFLSQVNQANS